MLHEDAVPRFWLCQVMQQLKGVVEPVVVGNLGENQAAARRLAPEFSQPSPRAFCEYATWSWKHRSELCQARFGLKGDSCSQSMNLQGMSYEILWRTSSI